MGCESLCGTVMRTLCLKKTDSGTGYYVPLSSEPERARLTAGEESCESTLEEGLLRPQSESVTASTEQVGQPACQAFTGSQKGWPQLKVAEQKSSYSSKADEYQKAAENNAQELKTLAANGAEALQATDAVNRAKEARIEKGQDSDQQQHSARMVYEGITVVLDQLKEAQAGLELLVEEHNERKRELNVIEDRFEQLREDQMSQDEIAERAHSALTTRQMHLKEMMAEVQVAERKAAKLEQQAQEARKVAKEEAQKKMRLAAEIQSARAEADEAQTKCKSLETEAMYTKERFSEAKADVAEAARMQDDVESTLSQICKELDGLAACVSNAQGLLGSSDPDYKQENSEKAQLREAAKQAALERKRGKAKVGRSGQEVTASDFQGTGSSKQALKASSRTDKGAGQTVKGQASKAFNLPARERESRLASETQEAADLGVPGFDRQKMSGITVTSRECA